MSSAVRFRNYLNIIQVIVPLPFNCSSKFLYIFPNPGYLNRRVRSIRYVLYAFYFYLGFSFSFLPLALFRRGINVFLLNLDLVALYTLLAWSLAYLFIIICTIHKFAEPICFLLNQSFLIAIALHERKPSDIACRLLLDNLASWPLLCPPAIALIPFLVNEEPFQIVLGTSLQAKTIAAVAYYILSVYGFSLVCVMETIVVALIDNILILTNKLRNRSLNGVLSFDESYINLQVSYMVCSVFVRVTDWYVTGGVYYLIAATTIANYMVVTMHSEMPLMITVVLGLAIPTNILLLCILTYFGSIPYNSVDSVKRHWEMRATRKRDKKRIRAIPNFGFTIGPYGFITAYHGLSLCDDIVNNTITVLLLDS